MSRELRCTYNASGGNLYVIIRRLSDGYVYSTVTTLFAAWADGSVADYDIALTDRGGDLYDGDFPSAIAAGDYELGYYERAGATPAITDLRLTTESPRHWDGAVLGSGSDIELSAYALTTLNNQKRYLRIDLDDADDDTLITQLINAVSVEIERICGIQFAARDRRERLNAAGQRGLRLKQYPVIDLFRLAWGRGTALTVSYSGSAVRADVGVGTLDVRISSYSTSGAATTSRFLFTDYPSLTLLAAAINAVSGWTATVTTNMPSADLNPQGGSDAKSHSVILTYPDRGDITYTVDFESGLVDLVNCPGWYGGGPLLGGASGYESEAVMPGGRGGGGHQYLFVHYRAGYESIPADVELMCNRLVADAYNEGFAPRDTGLLSIGPYTWKASKEQAETIEQQLARFMDVSTCIGGV